MYTLKSLITFTQVLFPEEHLVEKRWYWYKYRGWYKYGNRYYRYFPYRLDWAHAQVKTVIWIFSFVPSLLIPFNIL